MTADPSIRDLLLRRAEIRRQQYERADQLAQQDAGSREDVEAAELAWLDARLDLARERTPS